MLEATSGDKLTINLNTALIVLVLAIGTNLSDSVSETLQNKSDWVLDVTLMVGSARPPKITTKTRSPMNLSYYWCRCKWRGGSEGETGDSSCLLEREEEIEGRERRGVEGVEGVEGVGGLGVWVLSPVSSSVV